MAKDKIYQAMKEIAKSKGVKASPQHDLYKMMPPNFLNAFYSEYIDKKAHKLEMKVTYDAKCSYFDDLKLYMIEPDSTVKITDKVRANSVIQVYSHIAEEEYNFDFDGSDAAYEEVAVKTFAYIQKWYKDFFDGVKEKYGSLENFIITNQEEYQLQAAFIYIHQEQFEKAAELLGKMSDNINSTRLVVPNNDEQKQRLIDSEAKEFGDRYLRSDMDCIIDYVTAKMNGVEWTPERALYGLLNEER
jgi:hypothetical protein